MRRALCVGIDNYHFGPLMGCVNDAQSLGDVLSRHENRDPNFDVRSLIAPVGSELTAVTRIKLRSALADLFGNPADIALFSFSGHGSENNLGGYLVTQDASKYDEGVALSEVLEMANKSKSSEVVILLDSCHSGHLGNAVAVDNARSSLREGISIITSCRGEQVSVESNGKGLFTSLVIDALEGGAADVLGGVTATSVYFFVETALGAWDQRPLFKAHVSKLTPLRKCSPSIDSEILRDLPDLFPLPAEDLPLSPLFESSHPSAVEALTGTFQKLQALNRVHMVIPVGCEHMYDAAVGSKSCRLTPSGRYYWRLAKEKRI